MTPRVETRITTVHMLMCECGGDIGDVSRQLGNGPGSAGPWFCESCGRSWVFRHDGKTVVEVTLAKPRRVSVRLLLELPPGDETIGFVIDTHDYMEGDRESDEVESSRRYFYDEHTCPTNWLRHVVEVIADGETDPHGLWRYVREIREDENAT